MLKTVQLTFIPSYNIDAEFKYFAGCRMVSTTFQSGYDVTSWFNFKVEIGFNFTVIVDKSTYDQVTFYCLNSENKTDEVDFEIKF